MGICNLEKKDREKVRRILCNLETKADVLNSLNEFKEIMRLNMDEDLVVLVMQKVRNVMYDSYNIDLVDALIDVIHTERCVDELIKIFFDFKDREDFTAIISKLKLSNKVVLFKYLRELKDCQLLKELVEEMEREYHNIVESIT